MFSIAAHISVVFFVELTLEIEKFSTTGVVDCDYLKVLQALETAQLLGIAFLHSKYVILL